jgi:collagen type III alpha
MHAAPPLVDGFPQPGTQKPPSSGIEGDRPRMGGVFPGPGSGPDGPATGLARPTVTPPGQGEASHWPAADDQGRFEQFMPEPEKKAETPHVRLLPIIIGVLIGAALLVGAAFGLVYLISGDSDNAGLKVSVGDCVKREGEEATTAACADAGAYQVASIADTQDKCADPGQPYVVDPTSDGRTRVLCLKPAE